MLRRRAEKWARPAILAALIGLLGLFGKTDVVSDAASALSDRDMLIRWTSAFSGATRSAVPVTLIDVDADAMALYGSPDRAPRALLAGLLSLAAAKGASGVLLDVDLSRPGPDAAGDAALRETLENWPAQAPILALARRFRVGEEGETPEPFAFERDIAGRANIRQTASLALKDSDGVVRRWRLAQTVCAEAGAVAYPSPQLIAAAIAAGRAQGDLDRFLDWRARSDCASRDKSAAAKNAAEKPGPAPQWPRNPAEEANISFLFSAEPGAHMPEVEDATGRATALMRRIPARTLVDAQGVALPVARVADAPFAGRFVIIGATHSETFDEHPTPIGRLPGVVIAANAVAGAPAILSAARIGDAGRTLIALALFAAMAFASARLRAAAASVVVTLICLATAPLLGRLVAPSTALEIVASALAMLAAFAAAQSLWDIVAGWRSGLRWRVLLKPSTSQAENA
jgi:CHASE2 domain-containing sensor protein